MAFISFIIPAYNTAKYIEKCLNSLIQQTDKDFEIIVIDDGSEDNTYEVAENILKNSSINEYKILRKANEGVSSARNLGISVSKGDYLVFVDSDDFVSKELVAKIKEAAFQYHPDALVWKYYDVTDKHMVPRDPFCKLKYPKTVFTGHEILKILLIENQFIAVGSLAYYRKKLTELNLEFNTKHSVGEDQVFMIKYLYSAKNVVLINENLYYYILRPSSVTKNFNIRHFEAPLAYLSAAEYLKNLPDESSFKNDILQAIYEKAVFSFLSRFRHLAKHTKSYNVALDKIQEKYNDLFHVMTEIAKRTKSLVSHRPFIDNLALKFFQTSPKLYFYSVRLENKLTKLFRNLN